MTWVRLDDGFPMHPKVVGLSDRAFRYHVVGMCYCAQNLTDGFVPVGVVPSDKHVASLVEAEVWDAAHRGWLIHDYLEYNPSKQEVEQARSKKQAAGQAGGLARAKARAEADASAESKPVPVPHATANAVTPTQNQLGNELATLYANRQPMCNFPAVAGIARKALKAGHAYEAIGDALLRLADEGRGVTTETLRVELEGLPARQSLRHQDRAAEILKEAARESAAG